jgi:hypothetical protein
MSFNSFLGKKSWWTAGLPHWVIFIFPIFQAFKATSQLSYIIDVIVGEISAVIIMFCIGSCVVSVQRPIAKTHAPDEGRGHLLGVEQRLVCGDIQIQIGLMYPAKHPQIGAQPGARSFARVAMDFAHAIAIVVAGPLARAVADRPMGWMTARIAVGLIGIEHRAADRNVLVDQFVARPFIRVLTDRVPSG